MQKLKIHGIILLMAYLLTSCNSDVIYEDMKNINVSGWNYAQSIDFSFDAPDTVQSYNLIFDLRITSSYRYRNLWLFIKTHEPDGFTHIDTINCPIAYPDGRWIGSGMGDLIDNPILIHPQFKFTKLGEYTLSVRHGMRNNDLPIYKI